MWKPKPENKIFIYDRVLVRDLKIVMPISLRNQSIVHAHKPHLAADTTYRLAKEYVWWPGMKTDVKEYVDRCETCIGARTKPTPTPIHPYHFCDYPKENATILVVVDQFSRFLRLIPVKNKEAETFVTELEVLDASVGGISRIKSDGGPPMNSHVYVEWAASKQIEIIFSVPDHSRSNGLAERQMQKLNMFMKTCWMERKPWKSEIKEFEIRHNSTPAKTTGKPPSLVTSNRRYEIFPTIPLNRYMQVDWQKIYENEEKAREYMKTYSDEYNQAKPSTIKVGDKVFIAKGPNQVRLKLAPIYILENSPSRMPQKFQVIDWKDDTKRFLVKNLGTGKVLERDPSSMYKCPSSAIEMRRQEIFDDVASDKPKIKEVAGIPIEMIKMMEHNSSDNVPNSEDSRNSSLIASSYLHIFSSHP